MDSPRSVVLPNRSTDSTVLGISGQVLQLSQHDRNPPRGDNPLTSLKPNTEAPRGSA